MAGIIFGTTELRFAAPMNIRSNQPVFSTDTISLKRYTNTQPHQRWEISTRIEPSSFSPEMLLHTIINGYNTVFDVYMPQVWRGRNNNLQAGSTSATGSVGSSNLIITPVAGLSPGEFVTFTGHTKVYVVLTAVGSAITVFPALRANVSGSMIYGSSVIMKARYDTDTFIGIQYVDGVMSDPGEVRLIEAL